MIYRDFGEKKLPLLGFGAMRLPETENGEIDKAQVREMIKLAMAHGVNYFDTAWPYHKSMSETVLGELLSEYDRESFFLANKYPGHQISESYDPAEIFEKQLEKCRVDYFDFYLLHNVYERSMGVYLDPRWGIIDYLKEQKRKGRIRHLGFSSHGRLENLRRFLDIAGDDMEFCQIQLNYLDWTLQEAKEKYELLTGRGIPVFVMEPDASIASFAFRFLMGLDNVKLILSGMSNIAQMNDNLMTFETRPALSDAECRVLLEIAEGLKSSVPCTACRYCTEGCPMGLDIPMLIATYNELRFAKTTNAAMRIEGLSDDKKPTSCISCGKCSEICPQKIDVPKALGELSELIASMPSWEAICRERELAARRALGK